MTTPVSIRSTSSTSGATHVQIAIGSALAAGGVSAPNPASGEPSGTVGSPALPTGLFRLGQGSLIRAGARELLLLLRTGTSDWSAADFHAGRTANLPVDEPQDLLVAHRRDPARYRVGRLVFQESAVSADAGTLRYAMEGTNGAWAWARRAGDGTETWVIQPDFKDADGFRAQPQVAPTADWGADALAALGADAQVVSGRVVLEDLLG